MRLTDLEPSQRLRLMKRIGRDLDYYNRLFDTGRRKMCGSYAFASRVLQVQKDLLELLSEVRAPTPAWMERPIVGQPDRIEPRDDWC